MLFAILYTTFIIFVVFIIFLLHIGGEEDKAVMRQIKLEKLEAWYDREYGHMWDK